MDSVRTYLRRGELMRRDEQANWNSCLNLRIMQIAEEGVAWYCGLANAKVPQMFLSQVTNPGNDGECNGAHRLKSLVRTMRQFDSLETEAFVSFKLTSYEVLGVLGRAAKLPELDEAARALDAFFEYLERSRRRKSEDEDFAARLMGMVENYIAICARISKAFALIERGLLGAVTVDPAERRKEAMLEAVADGVGRLLRRAKVTPAGARARQWVKERWEYFKAHPEALKVSVKGRRTRLKDAWETDRTEAVERFGIVDFAAYLRIAAANRQASCRARGSGGGVMNEE